jgi:uncharacterized protein
MILNDSNRTGVSRKLKYPERFNDWRHVKQFKDRQIITSVGQVDTVKYQIEVDDVDLNGIRLLFFSDLHCGIHSSRLMHNDLIQSINQAEADIVICGGDLLGRTFDRRQTEHILSSCQAADGKFAAIGNWECYEKSKKTIEDWHKFYRQCGFSLLCNQSMNCRNICFYGIDDIKTGSPEFALNGEGAYTVLLSHNPDTVIHIAEDSKMEKFNLAICGHTHAGQVRLPLLGAMASASRYGRKFDCGHFSHRRFADKHMLISAGIGTSAFPWRVNCPPEIMVIDLVSQEKNN